MLVKVPDSVKLIFPSLIFHGDRKEQVVYLTFDDGPVSGVTDQVLDILKQYGARATFFEVGENVTRYPELHQRIAAEGHQQANHTHHHLNGWKVDDGYYLKNVAQADQYIKSDYFRPPYGRLKRRQMKRLRKQGYKIIMWDVLSQDYDPNNSPEQCLRNCTQHIKNGSIVLLHDSQKSAKNVLGFLPELLAFLTQAGYRFGLINELDYAST